MNGALGARLGRPRLLLLLLPLLLTSRSSLPLTPSRRRLPFDVDGLKDLCSRNPNIPKVYSKCKHAGCAFRGSSTAGRLTHPHSRSQRKLARSSPRTAAHPPLLLLLPLLSRAPRFPAADPAKIGTLDGLGISALPRPKCRSEARATRLGHTARPPHADRHLLLVVVPH